MNYNGKDIESVTTATTPPPTKPTSARESDTAGELAIRIANICEHGILSSIPKPEWANLIESLILAHTEQLQKRIEELEKALDEARK